MTLDTATLERFTTMTSALSPVTETPISRNPTAEEARRPGSPFDTMLYVTRIDSGDERHGDNVGKVITVTGSPSRDGWFHRNEHGNLQRVYGAPLNPDMVDGHYYRSLNGGGVLVRYNDAAHAGDRHIASLPLSILATNGTTWPIPGDGTLAWNDTTPYIEVEAPSVGVVIGPELPDAQQFVTDITVTGPTRGFAERNADGVVPLNPALEVGEMYLYWTPRDNWTREHHTEARMVTALAEDGEPEFSYLGYWTMERQQGEDRPYWYSSRRTVLDDSLPKNWAKLALTQPVPNTENDPANTLVWSAIKSREAVEFDEFNEATNTLADDNDWCSEYEGIVEALGMTGREAKVRDWDVEVDVTFSFTADSVSGVIDRAVASDYDIPNISISSARFTGSARVTVRINEQRNEDGVREYLDTNEVYEALNDQMSGVDDIEVDDYDVYEINEAD